MPKLYIITGPAGVGKSTISKAIAESKTKSSLIEGDDIYNQVIGGHQKAWKDGNHLDVFWDICIKNIEIYLSYGYDVIFNYIVTPNIFNRIKTTFSNYDTKFIRLITDEKTLIERDSQRIQKSQMKERCLILLNKFKDMNFDKNYDLDTSNLSIQETVNIIEKEDRFKI